MPKNELCPADALRTPASALLPDERTNAFAVIDQGMVRKITQADHHGAIARFELSSAVPIAVRIHFETARNLYLYAWFVYRFYPVAEQHALTSLEFALRERLIRGHLSKSKAERMGLSDLLKRARSHGLISNEALRGRPKWAAEMARQRYSLEQLNVMIASGCETISFDDSKVEPAAEDLAYDRIDDFIKYLPDIRNDYSHGSETLRHTVLRTFEIVADLISQLFPANT
ncbi:hypothetical protein FDZ73_15490 [bacterium]|nr:MAG: hypothetical protein FDZ73_15490 [bacterium]